MTGSGGPAPVAPSFFGNSELRSAVTTAALVIVLALAYWAVAARTPFPVGFWSDDASYVATARSLAQGSGYRHIQIPGEPLQTRYPPLYPALLSLGFQSGHDYPANWRLLLIPGAVAASALWLISVAYFRRVFEAPERVLWCAAALALASPVILAFVRYTMSDLVYGALSFGALLCLDWRRPALGRQHVALLLGAAILVALSILTRSIGLTLLPAAVIGLLLQRRWAHAGLFLAVVLAICGPWWAWQTQAAAANGDLQAALMTATDLSYGLWLPESLSQVAEVLRQNSLRILFSVANYQLAFPMSAVGVSLASPTWRTALFFGLAIGVVGLCAAGFVATARRRFTTLHGYLLLYGGLVWLWPFEPHRFLIPWSPFVSFFLLTGVFASAQRFRSAGAALVTLSTLALGGLFIAEDLRIVSSSSDRVFVRELGGNFDRDELFEAYEWIENEIPASELIASAGPGGVYLHSGRRGYFVWPDTDPYLRYYGSDREAWNFYTARSRSEMLSIYQEMSARFLTVYGELGIRTFFHQPNWLESQVLNEIAAKHPGRFERLYTSSSGTYQVYRMSGLGPLDEPDSPQSARSARESHQRISAVDTATGGRPNIVLITIESLRTDHVGFQDGRKDTTPFLDAIAAEAVVYEDASSVTSWTLAAHASIFTGLYPPAHQAVGPAGALDESYLTTAEVLGEAGYQTAGVVSGPYLRTTHKLHQGFQLYDDSLTAPSQVAAHGDVTNPAMIEALERFLSQERDATRPFFLFAYFWDPHFDYKPPPPYDEKFRSPGDRVVDLTGYEESGVMQRGASKAERSYVIAQYDGEIAATDAALQEFFESLRSRGLWQNTAIFVTSDHGEEFLEHGKKGHKNNLFVESVHVPLLVKYPSARPHGDNGDHGDHPGRGRRDARPVSLIDLHPTILELAGISLDDTKLGHGQSLLALDFDPDRAIFFDLKYVWFDSDPNAERPVIRRDWQAVRRGHYKLIEVTGAKRPFFFDIAKDPRELRNLARSGKQPARQKSLEEDLRSWRAAMARELTARKPGAEAELDEAEKERLRALGYLR